MSFQDAAAPTNGSAGSGEQPTASGATGPPPVVLGLPPLPTLRPLPALRPMVPMPHPPWEPGAAEDRHRPVRAPRGPQVTPHAPAPSAVAASPSATPPDPVESSVPSSSRVQPGSRTGGRVLVIGGAEPAGSPLASRLAAAGHRLALHGGGADLPHERAGGSDRTSSEQPGQAGPVVLPADRTDADAMAGVVGAAARALGGLDAVVILPAARPPAPPITLGPDAWADVWSHVLAADVLAAVCVAHAAAQAYLAQPGAGGRIVLVTGGPGAGLPAMAADAAIAALGVELARQLDEQGVAVSVVSARPGTGADRHAAEVGETVTMLLAAPALPGMTVRLGG